MVDETSTPPYYTADYPLGISRENIKDLDEERQIEVMVAWFHGNFEDPAERTPYESREGGYQWIWGGPYDANEELQNEFTEIIEFDTIQRAIERVGVEGIYDWAPIPKEGDYANFDPRIQTGEIADGDGDWPPLTGVQTEILDETSALLQLNERLDNLEELIEPIVRSQTMMGHNNPPEQIDTPISQDDWQGIKSSIEQIRTQTETKNPEQEVIEQEVTKLSRLASEISKWLKERAEKGMDAFIKTFGAALALKTITDGGEILIQLMGVIETATAWISAALAGL